MSTVLLTGCAGYIGSVMTRFLLNEGHQVVGLDSLVFGDKGIQELYPNKNFKFLNLDITKSDYIAQALPFVDHVIHLAGISGMPSCDKYPEQAVRINQTATEHLFDAVVEHKNIKRFVMASTTSIYGAVKSGETVDENSPPMPLSLYAETKLACERHILKNNRRSDLVSVLYRFPTAFGMSPRMRFDLTVNEFTRDLFLGRELKIYGETFWRPYCHVNDLSRACVFALSAEAQKVNNQIICVGGENQNYTKLMIYNALKQVVPNGKLQIVQTVADPRDYKVSFRKMENLGFTISKTLNDGIHEIFEALKSGHFQDPLEPSLSSVWP